METFNRRYLLFFIAVMLIAWSYFLPTSYADTVVATTSSRPYFYTTSNPFATFFYVVGDVLAFPFRLIGDLIS